MTEQQTESPDTEPTEDANQSETGKGSLQERLTHIVYCPQCRDEIGRFDDEDEAAEESYYHHIGTGHDPGLLTGMYRND